MATQRKAPASRSSGILRDIFGENGKWSLGRIMLITVFMTMIALWWLTSVKTTIEIVPPEFVTEHVHTVFLALLSYAGLTKFKMPLSDRLSGRGNEEASS